MKLLIWNLRKASGEIKIAEVDRQEQELDEAVKAYDSANAEILSLKSRLNDIPTMQDWD